MTDQNAASQETLSSQAIDAARDELYEIALDIHAHPELNYEEFYAADLLAGALEGHGFEVERGIGGVETAFRGTLRGGGGDGPTVAVLAEYDALPEIGHGCGHNLIAMAALGAGLGLQANIDSLPGRVVVVGTPAEEGGGGKIRLLEAGVFDEVDVALSSHPFSNRTVIPTETPLGESWSLAMVGYRYIYHGKAAHAAAAPEAGINALNAVIHLFTGIDAMRQHLREDCRIHGVITDGGMAPNVVPEFAAANFMLRCRDRDYLREVGIHHAERQLFQYTIDLTRDPTRRKIKNSKVKPQKIPAEPRAAKQRKPKRATPITHRAPVSPEELVQCRHAYDEARSQTTERREYRRIRAREERQRAKELGRCRSCPNPAIPGETRCPGCAEKHRQSHRRSAAKSRAAGA